jgi:hypothetical protein
LKQVDRQALELAMQQARRDSFTAAQLDSKLKGESWQEVAEFASFHCQIRALNLKPWQRPPCIADSDGHEPADDLLRRMLAAGVSKFYPDPAKALAVTEV